MSIGENIRRIREAQGMKQTDLAKLVGYKTRSSICKIESGECDPSQKSLARIAAVLNVRPSELIDEAEDGNGYDEGAYLNDQILRLVARMTPQEKYLAIEVLKRFAGK